MRLYHRTARENAEAILAGGFRDATGGYMTTSLHSGVWFSDVPIDANEGANGDTVLVVDLDLPEVVIAGYEWVQDMNGYREFLMPAELVNKHARVRMDPNESDMIRTEQVALSLKIPTREVRKWIRQGQLPAQKHEGRFRIYLSDWWKFLESARTEAS